MPGGFPIPARDMPSMLGRNDSVSGFDLSPTFTFDQINLDEIISEIENQEGAFDEDRDSRPTRRYHRHTQYQIQRMESFFNECAHPDDKQRKELGLELGLTPLQVKFWFQNKRTQTKAQRDREENTQLKTENQKLRTDNTIYKEALKNASCFDCRRSSGEKPFDNQKMMLENAQLREEIAKYSGIAANYAAGKFMMNKAFVSPSSIPRPSPQIIAGGSGGNPGSIVAGGSGGNPGGIGAGVDRESARYKLTITELVAAAMNELIEMAQMGEPLWFTTLDGTTAFLDEAEYNRRFPLLIGPKPEGFKREVSRESGIIFKDHVKLVETFMDVNQWCATFSNIVSSAKTLEVFTTALEGSYDGTVQVMTAEFQVPSPLAPNRESNFLRYCKRLNEGTWAVVDVSLDKLCPNPSTRCRRKPTGCIIQQVPNGYSKVTWVEHVEVEEQNVHNLLKPLVNFGNAFGAKCWMTTLDRQCERLANTMRADIPPLDFGVIDLDGRKNMLKLAERMVKSFFDGVSACSKTSWKTLSPGVNDVKIVTRQSVDDPGRPTGFVLIVASTVWLQHLPKRVFEFLCDKNSRSEWDLLSIGGTVHEMTHIENGRNPLNCVSVINVDNVEYPSTNNCMSMIQETMSDSMGSFLIYAPTLLTMMNSVLDGSADPDYVNILPSGYAILPDGTAAPGADLGGTLLTLCYQTLVDTNPTAELPLELISHATGIIDLTADKIKEALSREVA